VTGLEATAMLSVPADWCAAQASSLYVGADWLLYVDACAQYAESETIAPCLMLAQPGRQLMIDCGERAIGPAAAVLAAAGAVTVCDDVVAGAAFLYLDPLTEAGRVIQALCGEHGAAAWDVAAAAGWDHAWFERLLGAEASLAEVDAWVGAIKAQVARSLPPRRVLDRRLRAVAEALVDETAGRLSLPQFAQRVHCSPEHLRKSFRTGVGMTLSRYQMWRRLHRMSQLNCATRHQRRVEFAAPALTALQDAGFYDGPHGCRVIRRYFGLTAATALGPAVRHARA
jgi:AraC-like DNA-binding protein